MAFGLDYTECHNKKETETNLPVSIKLDKHLNNFGYYQVGNLTLYQNVEV